MGNDKDSFFDDLKRAYEMEERMAGVLIDLCEPAMMEDNVADPAIKKLRELLLHIQKDTIRHKETVQNMLAECSRDIADG